MWRERPGEENCWEKAEGDNVHPCKMLSGPQLDARVDLLGTGRYTHTQEGCESAARSDLWAPGISLLPAEAKGGWHRREVLGR